MNITIDSAFYDAEYGAHLEARHARDYAVLTFSHDDHNATFTLAIDEEEIADLRARFAAHAAKVRGGGSLELESIVTFGDSYRFTAHDADETVKLLGDLASDTYSTTPSLSFQWSGLALYSPAFHAPAVCGRIPRKTTRRGGMGSATMKGMNSWKQS